MQNTEKILENLLQQQMQNKIKNLYQISDITFEEISKKTNIDIDTLKRIWDGEEDISPQILAQILDAYEYYSSRN